MGGFNEYRKLRSSICSAVWAQSPVGSFGKCSEWEKERESERRRENQQQQRQPQKTDSDSGERTANRLLSSLATKATQAHKQQQQQQRRQQLWMWNTRRMSRSVFSVRFSPLESFSPSLSIARPKSKGEQQHRKSAVSALLQGDASLAGKTMATTAASNSNNNNNNDQWTSATVTIYWPLIIRSTIYFKTSSSSLDYTIY